MHPRKEEEEKEEKKKKKKKARNRGQIPINEEGSCDQGSCSH